MDLKRRNYRRLLVCILFINIICIFACGYYLIRDKIPDKVRVSVGNRADFDLDLPLTAKTHVEDVSGATRPGFVVRYDIGIIHHQPIRPWRVGDIDSQRLFDRGVTGLGHDGGFVVDPLKFPGDDFGIQRGVFQSQAGGAGFLPGIRAGGRHVVGVIHVERGGGECGRVPSRIAAGDVGGAEKDIFPRLPGRAMIERRIYTASCTRHQIRSLTRIQIDVVAMLRIVVGWRHEIDVVRHIHEEIGVDLLHVGETETPVRRFPGPGECRQQHG